LNPHYVSSREMFGSVISKISKFQLSKKSGLHLMNGVLIARGPAIRPGQIKRARIIDLAPTILYSMGMGIPESMDGLVLTNIFTEDHLRQHEVKYFDWEPEVPIESEALSSEEYEEIKSKLRGLGYIN